MRIGSIGKITNHGVFNLGEIHGNISIGANSPAEHQSPQDAEDAAMAKEPAAPLLGARPLPDRPVRVFVSYAERDQGLQQELDTCLVSLQRESLIKSFCKLRLLPGDDSRRQVREQLDLADVILLLVSCDFLACNACYEDELRRAIKRHQDGHARVIPIIARPTEGWEFGPLGALTPLPKNARPITLWPDRDAAWQEVARGIRKLVYDLNPSG